MTNARKERKNKTAVHFYIPAEMDIYDKDNIYVNDYIADHQRNPIIQNFVNGEEKYYEVDEELKETDIEDESLPYDYNCRLAPIQQDDPIGPGTYRLNYKQQAKYHTWALGWCYCRWA